MNWIIERIEEGIALCEINEKLIIEVPVTALPQGVKEGSVISLCVDSNETEKRKEKINSLMNSLFKD